MMDEELERIIGQLEELWVFGYGSILWNQGFSFSDQLVGYVDGYVRRFWQGNTTHRGTPRAPGRVATLIEHSQGRAWGVAFQLRGSNQIRQALDHLGLRECSLGGYACKSITFTERTSQSNQVPRTIPVLTFIAVPSNALYLGPTDLDDLASQIVTCRGNSGTNVEYILRTADYVQVNIPEDNDEHLFLLVQKIKEHLNLKTQIPSDDSISTYLLESHKVLSIVTDRQDNKDDSNSSYLSESRTVLSIVTDRQDNKDDSNSTYVLESQKVSLHVTNLQDNEDENLKQKMVKQLLLAFRALNNVRIMDDCNFQTNLTTLQAEKFALSI